MGAGRGPRRLGLPHDRARRHRRPTRRPGHARPEPDPRLRGKGPVVDAAARTAPSSTRSRCGCGRWTATGSRPRTAARIDVRHDPNLLPGFPTLDRHGDERLRRATSTSRATTSSTSCTAPMTAPSTRCARRHRGARLPGPHANARRDRPQRPARTTRRVAYQTDRRSATSRDPISGIAVGDLDHNGALDIVATTSNADVYAWNAARPAARSGFPVALAVGRSGRCRCRRPRAATPHSRLPVARRRSPRRCSPTSRALAQLDILMSRLRRATYTRSSPTARRCRAGPSRCSCRRPTSPASLTRTDYIRDSKLMYSVGVGDVLGTGKPAGVRPELRVRQPRRVSPVPVRHLGRRQPAPRRCRSCLAGR